MIYCECGKSVGYCVMVGCDNGNKKRKRDL